MYMTALFELLEQIAIDTAKAKEEAESVSKKSRWQILDHYRWQCDE